MILHGDSWADAYVGDSVTLLKTFSDGFFDMCVTSPPYWGLRDYGHDGQIGQEDTPDEFIATLVRVFRKVRRVLKDDGTCWVNIGDTYAANRSYQVGNTKDAGTKGGDGAHNHKGSTVPEGLKPKDLCLIPFRLALALQADGWYVRQDIIWSKPNPMPESVRDRCTKAHEYVFLLSKSEKYYFDSDAIKEPVTASTISRLSQDIESQAGPNRVPGKTNGPMKAVSARDSFKRENSKRQQAIPNQSVGTHRPDRDDTVPSGMRNKRSVWAVSTRGYAGAHFATFPPALIEPCILAGSRPGGIVLDPFGGSGTTAGVALKHGRSAVMLELNPEYAALMPARIESILRA